MIFVPDGLFWNKRPEQGRNGNRNTEKPIKTRHLRFFVPDVGSCSNILRSLFIFVFEKVANISGDGSSA